MSELMETDDGLTFYAEIPPQISESVIEFFFTVSGDENESRQWPPSISGEGNSCNYLYIVDDDYEYNEAVPNLSLIHI